MAGLKKAYLEITNVCNLRCEFCPGTRRKQGFLSPEGFEVLAGKLRPYVDYIYLHLMGEPLLHPQLSQLLEIAGELGFKVIITTNGTLLSRQVELLASSSAVHKISVSLHSFEGNESHDTDLSNYLENTIAAVQKLSAAGKICALRLWNLDGETTRGANADNDDILAKLEQAFPNPGRTIPGVPPSPTKSIWSGARNSTGPISPPRRAVAAYSVTVCGIRSACCGTALSSPAVSTTRGIFPWAISTHRRWRRF